MRIVRRALAALKRAWTGLRYRRIRRRFHGVRKLNLGCGGARFEGYFNVDIVPTVATDFVADIGDPYWLESDHFEEIRLDAVFEHLYRWQQKDFLAHVHRALQPGGRLVINWLPDFDVLIEAYRDKKPGIVGSTFDLFEVYRFSHGDPQPHNSPQQLHKDLFTRDSILALLQEVGFEKIEVAHAAYKDETVALNMNVVAVK
ncbi:MAG: hypothetical protein P9L99_09620 [Candidatus Lernaella stagnicola]|nr:hypothetical protein [Candidatus Lernaella stagnicola]